MSPTDKINSDIKESLKQKDEIKTLVLRPMTAFGTTNGGFAFQSAKDHPVSVFPSTGPLIDALVSLNLAPDPKTDGSVVRGLPSRLQFSSFQSQLWNCQPYVV